MSSVSSALPHAELSIKLTRAEMRRLRAVADGAGARDRLAEVMHSIVRSALRFPFPEDSLECRVVDARQRLA